jgi:hypothetical protein
MATFEVPARAVTSAELQQLKPMMLELAITRHSIELFAANDQRPQGRRDSPGHHEYFAQQ